MRVRAEQRDDRRAIEAVLRQAFPTEAEALLVDLLRHEVDTILSLVAEEAEQSRRIVGHILFSPVLLEGHADPKIMGLAPVAVMPECQRKGVGTALVQTGLDECRRSGVAAVVVLGHPEYYARFGFKPARVFSMKSEYENAGDAFMILELTPGCLRSFSGTIEYHSAFKSVE